MSGSFCHHGKAPEITFDPRAARSLNVSKDEGELHPRDECADRLQDDGYS